MPDYLICGSEAVAKVLHNFGNPPFVVLEQPQSKIGPHLLANLSTVQLLLMKGFDTFKVDGEFGLGLCEFSR